jgi:hypothetical protein
MKKLGVAGRLVAATALSLALTGCGLGQGAPVDNYLARLARSLERNIEPTGQTLPPLPRARELRIELQQGSLDLLDMLSLHHCELNITIGKSNSSLGKLAGASQRLLLELEFMELAPACIAALGARGDAELAQSLRQAWLEKRRQLPARVWNATLGGPEFRQFWKRPGHLGDYPSATGAKVPTALARLEQLSRAWLAGDYAVGRDELEPLLAEVRKGDGGILLAALELQRAGLNAAQPALRQRLDTAPLCLRGTPSPEGKILDTVVRKFFVGDVQPWSVRLARRRGQLIAPVQALEAALAAAMPTPYRAWTEQRDRLLESGTSAPRRHARMLAELLESCGLRPGSDDANTA